MLVKLEEYEIEKNTGAVITLPLSCDSPIAKCLPHCHFHLETLASI